jgi:hypothetical protein
MKRILTLFMLVCTFAILASCSQCSQKADLKRNAMDLMDINAKSELAIKMLEYLTVIDNRFVFTLTQKEAMEKGFSEEEYDIIMKNIVENNKYFKNENVQNVKEMLDNLRLSIEIQDCNQREDRL